MAISTASLVEQLKRAVPGFVPDAADVEEELAYPIINDLGRYICTRGERSAWDEVDQAVQFLEGLLATNDSDLHQLVGDCLWGLSECPSIAAIRPRFGPRVENKAREYPPRR
jgi:hypothetical protein